MSDMISYALGGFVGAISLSAVAASPIADRSTLGAADQASVSSHHARRLPEP
jgi:hypothetical protein